MPKKSVEQGTEEIFQHPKNRILRFFRRGGSREDATFVASTKFFVDSKIALGQGDAKTHSFASRIKNAKTVNDIKRAIDAGMKEDGKLK